MRWILLLALLPTLALAQSPPRSEDLGTVTGHITCADTQRPARLAQVRLIPARNPTAYDPQYVPASRDSGTLGLAVHTDLTGGYTIDDVEPGQYYLRIDLDGYATPILQFTLDDLKSPTPEVQQQIQNEVQSVTVTAGSTVQADATIRRAGSISGTVTYDDGAPAINFGIALLHRDAAGALKAVRNGNVTFTNSRGQFLIESVMPGDYVIETKLAGFGLGHAIRVLAGGKVSEIPSEISSSLLPVYIGNTFRSKDAVAIKVDAGQETDNADIAIPLNQLHEISGAILAKDGHIINSGQVELLDPDTHEPIARVGANADGIFHLSAVPEGSYIFKVTNAQDVTPIDLHSTSALPLVGSRRTLRTYGDLEQPITVHSDIQSLHLIVPDAPSTPTSK